MSVTLPSSVAPERSSRKIVTTRATSSATFFGAGRSRLCRHLADALDDDRDLLRGMSSGSGSTTTLKRRFSAEDSSLTPLSRLLAVAMMLNPRCA